jgi:hypothetical protein
VSQPVRFEDDADLEYRQAGRWYEARQVGFGVEFFDAVDAPSARSSRSRAPGLLCLACPETYR